MTDYYVYIASSQRNGTLYVGVTNNLIRRIFEHKSKLMEGFCNKYNIANLVYFEVHNSIREAIIREKQIKKWHRPWKIKLIEENNPTWEDLFEKLFN